MIQRYKYLILPVFLCLWTSISWAQEPRTTWLLNKDESSESKNYVARESVALQSNGTTGFHFKADGGKIFSAKIDAGLLFPPNDKTYALPNGIITTDKTLGGVVGSIPGSASVSPTGAATYQIPIEVPAGINGMQPNISLVYNSQGGAGALGIGWDVAGCSAITRGGKNIYFDGQSKSVQSDQKDVLYLDGQRLIYISGGTIDRTGEVVVFTDGAIFATETENYSHIVYNNGTFTVTTVDGKIMEYGNSTNSKLVTASGGSSTSTMSWKLNKVTDSYGNCITYTYSDSGQYLAQIDYAGQTILFGYVTNTVNPRKSYIRNFLVSQSKLLSTVTIQSGSKTLKTYSFSYLNDNRLNTISETAGDNTKVNSTSIHWGAETNDIQFNKIGTITDTELSSQPEGRSSIDFADINGDGYPDRIERSIGNPGGHIKVYFYDSVNKTFNNAKTATLSIPFADYDTYHQQVIYADIDNDGKAEIIYTDNNNLYAEKYIPDNTSYSFFPCFTERIYGDRICTSNFITDYYANKKVKLIAADVNHDGYSDIVLAYYNKGPRLLDPTVGRRGYAIFYGGQNGLNPTPDCNWSNPDYTLNYLEVGDFDADGKLDIVGLPGDWSNNELLIDNPLVTMVTDGGFDINDISGTKEQVLDINGDGLSDLIAMCPTIGINYGTWRSSTNTGGVFNQPILKNEPFKGPNVHFIDINGDGLVDAVNYTSNYDCNYVPNPAYDGYNPWEPEFICMPYYVNTIWNIYLNTGSGNFASPLTYTTYNAEIKDPNLISISDINGDGIPDLIITQGADMYALTMPNANRRNLVNSITNGMNQTESFTYKNFSGYDAYNASEATTKVRPLRAPMLLVDTYTQANGNMTSYEYTSPRYHTEGKGFLGFTTVTATNIQKNAKVTSNYDINQTYFFSVLTSQHVSTATGTDNISVSSQTNGVKVIDATHKRYIPIVTNQNSTDVLKGITQTSTADYSNYPNSLTQTTTAGNLTSTTVTTFTGPSGATPYLPATVISNRTQNGETYSRTTGCTYQFDGSNPYKITGKTETVDPGDANSVATTFSNYDVWGHPQSVAITANGITRSSSVSYTSTRSTSGRFLQSKTDVLLETTNYNWNESTGLLDSETDPRGHITTFSYDGFGQLKETVFPDGNRKTSVLQWAGTDGVSGALYYSYSQVSGSAPVTVWYDTFGREIQSDTYGLNNKKISVSTEYYTANDFTAGKRLGMVYRVSEPYFEADAANKTWAKTFTYDEFGLPKKVITPMGEVLTEFNKLITTVTTPEGTTETTLNSNGQTVTSKVNGKAVTYEYYASGLTKSSIPEGGQAISMVYNLQGKQIKLIDPDGGFIRSEYNGFGEHTLGVQRIHLSGDSIRTVHFYKPDGRLESINRNGEITTYTYNTSIKGRVNVIELKDKNGHVKNRQTFTYDPTNITDRVTNVKEEIVDNNGNLKTFNTGTEYDALGRVKKEIYPSGYYTVNTYDGYGNLTETKDQYNRLIWKANAENARGQITSINKGNKTTTYDYWDNGLTKEIKADGVVDMYYEYESKSHNLHLREDKLVSQNDQKETFGYDGLNRLINWTVNRNGTDTPYSMTYDDNTSNITSKSDLGAFTLKYAGEREDGGAKAGIANGALTGQHALTTIVPNSGTTGLQANMPNADLNVTYTDFKKIATLSEGTKFYRLTYGTDDERCKTEYYANGLSQGNATLTRYSMGSYEEEVNSLGNVRKIHYLGGAILIQNNGVDSLLYTYSDAQGSLIALADVNGNLVEKYAYDPWGARRNPNDWTQKDSRIKWIVNRGYTGHEHIDAFAIINMNGRVYDPATGMFFSPDPTLTDAGNWLDYNRYSYCLNNPFKYTDPSGYSWWAENWQPVVTTASTIAAAAIAVVSCGTATPVIASGMLAGAAGGFTGGAVGTAVNGGSFSDAMGAGIRGAIIGGFIGALSAGTGIIGDTFGHTVGTIGNEFLRAGAHATLGGIMNIAQGNDFLEGFAVGAVSSLVGSGLQALDVDLTAGILISGAVGAGTATLLGGNSVNGALQGLSIGAFNHFVQQPNGSIVNTLPNVTVIGHRTLGGHTLAWWARASGAITQVNVEFDVILGGRLAYNAATAVVKKGVTVIGEGMGRVEATAAKIPGSVILNDMPVFTGTTDQVTSQMMQSNRKWILEQLRSGNKIIDIGVDINRTQPSIFYQMEQNMIKNYRFLHP